MAAQISHMNIHVTHHTNFIKTLRWFNKFYWNNWYCL